MEIVICGRNVEVPEHFRDHTTEKLARLGRYDHKIIRVSVELSHEPNPRRAKTCQSIQITGRGKGPVVRAVGCAGDFYSALDLALGRLEERMRRQHDRRLHKAGRRRVTVGRRRSRRRAPDLGAELDEALPDGPARGRRPRPRRPWREPDAVPAAREALDDRFGRAVDGRRAGAHRPASRSTRRSPMTVDDALSRMELVGHDFFLFSDNASGRPSVVYRRHGYDYGVIDLAETAVPGRGPDAPAGHDGDALTMGGAPATLARCAAARAVRHRWTSPWARHDPTGWPGLPMRASDDEDERGHPTWC